MASNDWKVSLHGGHSGEFCEHATSTLREVLEAAVAFGYHTFGVSEHVPRSQDRFLYRTEREKDYTPDRLHRANAA
jgi:histidinol-phosphatase (PHP family)